MKRPYHAHPRDLNPGDNVEFSAPQEGGITVSYTGRVRNLGCHGETMYWKTNEGSTVVKWHIKDTKTRVLILDREPQPQSILELFSDQK